MNFELTQARIVADLDAVATEDADVAQALARHGYPSERRAGTPSFEYLLRVLVGQQLSVKAAATIYARLEAAFGQPPDPATLNAASDEALRQLGLSRQKQRYARGLADAVLEGRLPFETWPTLSDEAVIENLVRLKGFGLWSAQMVLLFTLGRVDVWPADDLGIQAGVQRLKGRPTRPKRAEVIEYGEAWRPRRGAMALFMWHLHAQPYV